MAYVLRERNEADKEYFLQCGAKSPFYKNSQRMLYYLLKKYKHKPYVYNSCNKVKTKL